jgi:hypothetical protein
VAGWLRRRKAYAENERSQLVRAAAPGRPDLPLQYIDGRDLGVLAMAAGADG